MILNAVLNAMNHVIQGIGNLSSRVLSPKVFTTSRTRDFGVASNTRSDSIDLIRHPNGFFNPRLLSMGLPMMFPLRLTVHEKKSTFIALSNQTQFSVLRTFFDTVNKVCRFSKDDSHGDDDSVKHLPASLAVDFRVELIAGQRLLRDEDMVIMF